MTDLDRRLARMRPDVPAPAEDWLAATRTALLDRAAGAPPPRRRLPHRGLLVAAAAGIAVLAALALVVPATNLLSPARQHLQYVYVKTGFTNSTDQTQLTMQEGWYPLDSGKPVVIPDDRPYCSPTTSTSYGSASTPSCRQLGPGSVQDIYAPKYTAPGIIGWSYQQLLGLPTDPAALRTQLYAMATTVLEHKPKGNSPDPQDYGADTDSQVYILISETLLKAVTPAQAVTAFYQVLPTIPGVTAVPAVKDAVGRAGVGYVRDPAGGTGLRTTLVFEAGGHRFLGMNGKDATGFDYTPSLVILSSGVVGRLGERR